MSLRYEEFEQDYSPSGKAVIAVGVIIAIVVILILALHLS